MGNKCNCVASQSTDEAEDALLGSEQQAEAQREQRQQSTRRFSLPGRQVTRQAPRGPPPPYQQVNPFYMLTEEQRLHIVTRLALIQSLPIGHYESKMNKDAKKPPLGQPLPLEEKQQEASPEKEKGNGQNEAAVEEEDFCEKSDKYESRECPICMNDFLQGDPIRLLPCMHYYHTRCIDEWLMRAITCPNCMERVDVAFQRTAMGTSRRRRSSRGHRRSVSRGSANSVPTINPPAGVPMVTSPVGVPTLNSPTRVPMINPPPGQVPIPPSSTTSSRSASHEQLLVSFPGATATPTSPQHPPSTFHNSTTSQIV